MPADVILQNVFAPASEADHILTIAPTVLAGAAAGTAPPAATLLTNSNDLRGAINSGSGTSPAAGSLVALTFGTPYTMTPIVVLSGNNNATQALGLSVISISPTGFTVAVGVAPAASQAIGTYVVNYVVMG